jgi:hypothetical protein
MVHYKSNLSHEQKNTHFVENHSRNIPAMCAV